MGSVKAIMEERATGSANRSDRNAGFVRIRKTCVREDCAKAGIIHFVHLANLRFQNAPLKFENGVQWRTGHIRLNL